MLQGETLDLVQAGGMTRDPRAELSWQRSYIFEIRNHEDDQTQKNYGACLDTLVRLERFTHVSKGYV